MAYATGNDGSEAVNVDYLNDKIKDASDDLINKGLKFDANQGGVKTNKLGSKVTVKGEGNRADANYSGDNIKTFIDQDGAGNTSITVKMDKNIIADSIKVNQDLLDKLVKLAIMVRLVSLAPMVRMRYPYPVRMG